MLYNHVCLWESVTEDELPPQQYTRIKSGDIKPGDIVLTYFGKGRYKWATVCSCRVGKPVSIFQEPGVYRMITNQVTIS